MYLLPLATGSMPWRSKKRSIVLLSTINAEYVALYTEVRKVICLRNWAARVVLVSSELVCLNGANQNALKMYKEATLTEASKHSEIYYHFIS